MHQTKVVFQNQPDADEDYQRLLTIDPLQFKNQAKPWTEYLLGKIFKADYFVKRRFHQPSSVVKHSCMCACLCCR